MKVRAIFYRALIVCSLIQLFTQGFSPALASDTSDAKDGLLSAVGPPGGLCVQLGAADPSTAARLAHSGRWVVHVLDPDSAAVETARQRFQSAGIYGLASAERLDFNGGLPYTENLVNLVIVSAEISDETWRDIGRVICPLGVVLAKSSQAKTGQIQGAGLKLEPASRLQGGWLAARKPWPPEMDEWTHPRHSASGNAVSRDTLAGPPRRIRWLAGPWAEVANLVTDHGRNYYGGVLTRDGFNGLRLWQRSLSPSPSKGNFSFRPARGSVPPIAGDQRVFAFTGGKLVSLDGGSGKVVQEYPEAGKPLHVLYDEGVLISVGVDKVQSIDAKSGRVLWSHAASEPRHVVAGDDLVALIQGSPRRGETCEVAVLNQRTGQVKWKRGDLPWATKATRSVYHQGLLTFEVSSLNDDGADNAIHIVSAEDGKVILDREFLPGMNHMRQARPMYVGDQLWLLHGGRDAKGKKQPTQISSIDLQTGKAESTYPAGLAHCFPPVATPRFLLSGVMEFTDLKTGVMDANCITKAACGRDSGWVPAHGLVYVTPKHCVCWPMLRGYAALAPARPGGNPARQEVSELSFTLETGVDAPAGNGASEDDWPCYRHDAWRSGSTATNGPSRLTTRWTAHLGGMPGVAGPILEDWREDPYSKGSITAPVISGGRLFVARPHAHQVVALDAATGQEQWRFTATGRVDTPPTIHRDLCLFGSKSGWVYCLRADNGQLVWRLRAAPLDERIVAYGQLESPWPVPGSVLVVDDVAYFAAGRQSFADGGILVFAVDPSSGKRHWVRRLDTIPQKGYYTSSGLEFDNFDLLFREGDGVAMARWVFDRATGSMSVDLWKAFARLNTGNGSAMVPQGFWSYAPRNQSRTKTFSPRRPLVAFRDKTLFGCMETKQSVYRRDFDLEGTEKFDTKWITGWAGSDASRKDGVAWRCQRLAQKASWKSDIYHPESDNQTIDALVLAGDKLYLAGSGGELRVVSTRDGKTLTRQAIPAPSWDGMAVAGGRLFLATRDGQVLCLGD